MSTVLVTGGGGFLGLRIVELLREGGHEVRSVSRSAYPALDALGVRSYRGDIREPASLVEPMTGCDTVIHVASKAGYWGSRDEFHGINVDGTRHVVAAATAASVRRLVYTSTPSVIGYATEAIGIATAPYPPSWESMYGETKAAAEQLVLAANGASSPDGGRLQTVSLRPHLIVGPRDNHLLPRVVDRARQGRLAIVGDGENTVDVTYVDNAAWAHLDALERMGGPDAACAGKAYFVSNDEPVKLWPWVNELLGRIGVPPVTRKVSLAAATRIGGLMEFAWGVLPLPGEPRMTRFLAAALARSHWYDMGPAKRDLGYRVRVPLAEGTDRTVAWLKEREA